MGITRIAITRPLFMLMAILAVVLLGLVSYTRLGVDLLPSIDFPVVSVVTIYPGAGPEAVESQVTKPIEDAVAGLNGLDYIQSTSSDGLSTVVVFFKDGVSVKNAAIDVERKVQSIRGTLPKDIEPPTVGGYDPNALPILNLALSGPLSVRDLHRAAEDQIVPRLSTLNGVASVSLVGGQAREIQVKVDQGKLQGYGLSLLQVTQALASENLEIPSGSLTQVGRQYAIRVNALVSSPQQLGSLIVSSSPSGVVYLRDVAEIADTTRKVTRISRVNGEESVGIQVTKQSDANTLQVADAVKLAQRQLQPALPEGAEVSIVTDSSTFTRASLDDVRRNLTEAILLTGVVLLVFLHTLRSTVIVLLAIPTSIIATFLVMFVLGFTLNMMSMMALALTVGILVDDSIVVLENIFRHLELGDTQLGAALAGRSEIGLAAIAITLVDVVVFTPVAFMSGIVGQYFRQFGLVVAAATLFSLAVSFTLTPLLASRWLRLADPRSRNPLAIFGRGWDRMFEWLGYRYQGLAGWALRHRWLVIFAGVLSFVAGAALIPLGILSTEFMPESDQGEIIVLTEMPPSTSLEASDAAVRQVEARLAQMPEVDRYFAVVGTGGFGRSGPQYGQINVKLVERRYRAKSQGQVSRAARGIGEGIPGMTVRVQEPSMAGPAGQSLTILVQGQDRTVIDSLAGQVMRIVQETKGAVGVTNSAIAAQPEIVLNVDRQRAADVGLTAQQIAGAARTAIAGSVVSQYRTPDGKNVDIRVIAKDVEVSSPERIRELPVVTTRGAIVRLGQIADIQIRSGPSVITRRDRQRLVTVGGDLEGRPLGDASAEIDQRIRREIEVPPGYKIGWGGATQAQQESFEQLFQALGLSVVLMYMLMVALFESLLYPFIIMLSLPLALVGAFGGLVVTGNTLNMMSLIGVIMLTGLVGKNAILLVDYTNTLRQHGNARDPALLEAGRTRLRPILMTTAALVFAMLPLVLKLGEGSEWRAPMAAVVMGGLITSTLLTLVFIPAIYTVFDDFQGLLRGRRRKRRVVEQRPVVAREPATVARISIDPEPQV